MYGVLAVVGTMGPWYLLLLLGHCVVLYVASLLGQRWLCFALGLASLASFKMDPGISWQVRSRGNGVDTPKVPPPKPLSKATICTPEHPLLCHAAELKSVTVAWQDWARLLREAGKGLSPGARTC